MAQNYPVFMGLALSDAMRQLTVFLGEWRLGLGHEIPPPGDAPGRSVFEWILDGRFLVQQSDVSAPNAPKAFCLVAEDAGSGGYMQHYFDSRGVVRLYAMTFQDGVWTLLREKPDFTPLDFKQRFTGRFSEDRNVIFGTWEKDEGSGYCKDFDLTYARQ